MKNKLGMLPVFWNENVPQRKVSKNVQYRRKIRNLYYLREDLVDIKSIKKSIHRFKRRLDCLRGLCYALRIEIQSLKELRSHVMTMYEMIKSGDWRIGRIAFLWI